MPVIFTTPYRILAAALRMAWDPAFKSPLTTLSNQNLSATNPNSGAYGPVLATKGFSGGKRYWEITVAFGTDGHWAFFAGIALSTVNLSLVPGFNMPDAYAVSDHVTTGAVENGVYGCFLDMDNLTFVVQKNGAPWSGASLYASNVVVSNIVAGTWYPITAPVAGDLYTANFGDTPFAYPPTGGFIGAAEP